MPELLDPTSRITALRRKKGITIGLMTDARFSGVLSAHSRGSKRRHARTRLPLTAECCAECAPPRSPR